MSLSPSASRLLGLLACLAAFALATPRASAQDTGPEGLAKMALESFGDALDDYDYPVMEEALGDLDMVYAKVSPKTLKKIHKAIAKLFKTGPNKAVEWGAESRPEDDLVPSYQLAIGMIYDKDEGPKLIRDALKQRHVKEWGEMRATFIEALAQRVEESQVDTLIDYLEDEHPDVVVAAAQGLKRFSEHDGALRKECAEALLDAWLERHAAMEKEARKVKEDDPTPAGDFLLRVEGSFEDGLTRLTRQRMSDPLEWREWFAEHGADEEAW